MHCTSARSASENVLLFSRKNKRLYRPPADPHTPPGGGPRKQLTACHEKKLAVKPGTGKSQASWFDCSLVGLTFPGPGWLCLALPIVCSRPAHFLYGFDTTLRLGLRSTTAIALRISRKCVCDRAWTLLGFGHCAFYTGTQPLLQMGILGSASLVGLGQYRYLRLPLPIYKFAASAFHTGIWL